MPKRYAAWITTGILIAVLVAICAVATTVLADRVNEITREKRLETVDSSRGKAEKKNEAFATARKETILVMAVDKDTGALVGTCLLRVDASKKRIVEVDIRSDVLLPTGDGTYQTLEALYAKDQSLAMMRLSNFLQIPYAHWLVVPQDSYVTAAAEKAPAELIREPIKTNFRKTGYFAYLEDMEKLASEQFTTIELPTMATECDDDLFIVAHREKVARKLGAAWSFDPSSLTAPPSVAIYNGTKRSGLATEVSKKLILHGFQPTEVGNAPSNSYDATEIHSTPAHSEEAKRLATALGLSRCEYKKRDADEKDDLVVYVGKDYR